MPKINKNGQSAKDEENNVDDNISGVKSTSKVQKAKAKNVKKVLKPRDVDTFIGEMVHAALKALKNDGGVSLIQIRKFILNNYEGFGTKMGKERQAEMRQFMKEEFQKGTIVMTNYNGDTINFIMRFNLAGE